MLPPRSNLRLNWSWDATSGQETLTPKGHTRAVTSVAFSPDRRTIITWLEASNLKFCGFPVL